MPKKKTELYHHGDFTRAELRELALRAHNQANMSQPWKTWAIAHRALAHAAEIVDALHCRDRMRRLGLDDDDACAREIGKTDAAIARADRANRLRANRG